MNRDLHDTKASAILTALTDARHRSGTAAMGMVLTLVVDVDESAHYDALQAANAAAREHPCRIVTVIRRPGKSPPRLDAEIRVGDENSLGEVIVLRLYGVLREQADSIVLPMLLPDAPVLVWWPGEGPAVPSKDQLGLLAQRRVTDAASRSKPTEALRARRAGHAPGDTDFAWTRITPWRTLLAAALDQPFDPIIGGEVGAARNNASAELLATWLETRLGVTFTRTITRGPGITNVALITARGAITVTRPDGRLAALIRTGQPDRAVALPRRSTDELLAEELRRLDPDDVYNETIQRVFGGSATGEAAQPEKAAAHPRATAAEVSLAEAAAVAGTPRTSTTARALRAKAPLSSKKASAEVTAPSAEAVEAAPKGAAAKKAAPRKAAAKEAAPRRAAAKKAARPATSSGGASAARSGG